MDNTQVKQYIDNVNINIETPSDDSDIDLQALERDNWGRILNNKTFKVMKENFRLIKTSFNNFISNVSNEINTLVNKTNTIENNVNTIQTTVNELKANGGKINESTLSTLANKETVNTFKEVNTFEKGIDSTLYKLNTNELANMQGETITVGDITKSINIIGKDTTLLYNGMEIKGGGSSGGVGKINLSGTLGVPVIAETYSILSLPTLTIKKNEVLNAIVYTKESDYLKILNGEIKIPSLEFNRNAKGYNQDTPLVKVNRFDGDTNNNYFIPNNQTSNLYEAINQILNDNISSLVPFNNIYGISFDIKTTITKNMSDGTKKVFEGVIPFRIKFKKDNATDLTSLKSNRNNFEHIYSTGYDYGDFLKLLDFNSRTELCFKMNLSGARNDLGKYDTVSKTMSNVDTYTVFYITNTRDLFEGDFTTVKIEFEVNNAKVLLKI